MRDKLRLAHSNRKAQQVRNKVRFFFLVRKSAQTNENQLISGSPWPMGAHTDLQKTRFLTNEYYIYYFFVLVALAYLVSAAMEISTITPYQSHLRPGWLTEYRDYDQQYEGFRKNFWLFGFALSGYCVLSKLFRRRVEFICLFNLLLVGLLHGMNALLLVSIVLVNFITTKFVQVRPKLVSWIFNLVSLFLVHHSGFSFNYSGLFPRWNILYNLTMLRLLSFSLDYHTPTVDHSCALCVEKPCQRKRIGERRKEQEFSLIYYFAYVFYFPLFLAGPIITFNNFVSQIKNPRPIPNLLWYGIRLVFALLLLEVIFHYFHVIAIKDAKTWTAFTPLQFSAIGYFNLKIIWLKLLVIWRFCRFFAMVDGVVPEENMDRCMSNNYSCRKFWKHWHKSFNQWLVRYIYIPLGGSGKLAYNVWIIFTFVAVWHDVSLQLLSWSWLICLFLLPEIIASVLSKKFGLVNLSYYRNLCAVGASFNIILMMVANLVGFAIGLDGMKEMALNIFTLNGLPFVFGIFVTFYSAAMIMFEIEEYRESK